MIFKKKCSEPISFASSSRNPIKSRMTRTIIGGVKFVLLGASSQLTVLEGVCDGLVVGPVWSLVVSKANLFVVTNIGFF